jgi:carbon monoxide dehydrogenase subunit G
MRLENSFEVPGSPENAWDFLLDVPRVVPCMPGATLTETVADDRWKAVMAVKLGPVKLSFDTDVTREQIDESTRSVVLAAKAREQRGGGAATATITTSLSGSERGTQVDVATDLSLSGPVARYGRSLVHEVSQELVMAFATRVASEIEATNGGDGATAAAQAPARTRRETTEPRALRLVFRAAWRSLLRGLRRRRASGR